MLGISTTLPHKNCAAKKISSKFYLSLIKKELEKDRDQNNKMRRKNTQSCQIALNVFKVSELNFKNQLDLLQTAISRRKSFRTLILLISNIKETKEELRKAAEKVFLENAHPSKVSSIRKTINCRSSNMKSLAWMTMDNSASRPHDSEMTLASV